MNEIITPRLILKPLKKEDDELLFNLHSSSEVMKYIREPDSDIFQTKKFINSMLKYTESINELGLWCAYEKISGEFLGWGILLHIQFELNNPIEVGYRILEKNWGKGFGTEISKALVEYGRNIGLDKICGVVHNEHTASQRVLEKSNLEYIGIKKFYGEDLKYYEINLNDKEN